jgi:hypothetical protein
LRDGADAVGIEWRSGAVEVAMLMPPPSRYKRSAGYNEMEYFSGYTLMSAHLVQQPAPNGIFQWLHTDAGSPGSAAGPSSRRPPSSPPCLR